LSFDERGKRDDYEARGEGKSQCWAPHENLLAVVTWGGEQARVYSRARIMSRLRIFISSTMDDLRNERREVVKRLKALNAIEPVNAEGILPDGGTSWDRISDELDDCDLFVLILGDRYGWRPPPGPLSADDVSVTEGEYRAARELDIPVLPFYKKLGEKTTVDADEAARRKKFRDDVADWTKGQFRTEFDYADELGELVMQSVVGLLSNEHKRRHARSAASATPDPGAVTADDAAILPPGLLEAVRSQSAMLFAGSGISLSAGLPSSYAFAAHLVAGIRQRLPRYEPPQVGAGLASIAGDYELIYGRQRLGQAVAELLLLPDAPAFTDAHLVAVQRFPVIVTTNYDLMFERARDQLQLPMAREVAPGCTSPLPERVLVKLHGSISDPATLVITDNDLARYEETHKQVVDDLRPVFQSRPVVVSGTTLRDPSVYRMFRMAAPQLRGWCVVARPDTLVQRRLQGLGLTPVEAELRQFFAALAPQRSTSSGA